MTIWVWCVCVCVCVCVSLCGGSSRGVSITLVVFILQISIMASMAFNRIITKPVLVNYNYTLGFVLFLFYGERHRWGRERGSRFGVGETDKLVVPNVHDLIRISKEHNSYWYRLEFYWNQFLGNWWRHTHTYWRTIGTLANETVRLFFCFESNNLSLFMLRIPP